MVVCKYFHLDFFPVATFILGSEVLLTFKHGEKNGFKINIFYGCHQFCAVFPSPFFCG